MKLIFKKNFKNWRTVGFLGCLIILLILLGDQTDERVTAFFLLTYPSILLIYFRQYAITENRILEGNGRIPIEHIIKLVQEPQRITIYYFETKQGKTKIKTFYPKEPEKLVKALLQINPKIKAI